LAAEAQNAAPLLAGGAPLVRLGEYVLWHDPGAVETLDFRYGIGGPETAPKPPFTFVEEDETGSTPKVRVRDAEGRQWVIKFGEEASPDTFCTRLAWALGYYVEPTYFVAEGTIQGAAGLRRAKRDIDSNGRFEKGRFQQRSAEPKFLKYATWSWSDNPFVDTPELKGLKILMMLLSNWDDKDARDAERRGANTAIYQQGNLLYYFIDDWGAAMGSWGKFFTRSKWSASSYARQSQQFVALKDGRIHWGYVGQHSALMMNDIQFGDVAWLMRYLGRVTDDQLRTGMLSSGATPEQAEEYVAALRMRISELRAVANP
jgi:hypothetical protein